MTSLLETNTLPSEASKYDWTIYPINIPYLILSSLCCFKKMVLIAFNNINYIIESNFEQIFMLPTIIFTMIVLNPIFFALILKH